MSTRQDQRELSDVPRRHGGPLGRLTLVAAVTLAAHSAVSVGPTSGRGQLPNSDAVGLSLNRGAVGERVLVALEGEFVDYAGWDWTPGPVNYTDGTGVLTQGAGVPFGVAITPTRLLILSTGSLPSVVALGAQPHDATLDALAAYNTNGILTQTAADTFVGRTLAAPAAGITITNPAGTAGNPTFALANDLSALEALASTGFAARTGSDAWAQRTITGTSAEISVADGNGVSGNPTISLPAAITLTGKTITGGTHVAAAFNGTVGATTPSTVAATSVTATGNLVTTAGSVAVSGAAGSNRLTQYQTAGSLRWAVGAGTGAESGSDAGSAFGVYAYTDAGAFIDAPLQIVRATGGAIVISRPTGFGANAVSGSAVAFTGGTINGTSIGATTKSTGAFTSVVVGAAVAAAPINSQQTGAATDNVILSNDTNSRRMHLTTSSAVVQVGSQNSDLTINAQDVGTALKLQTQSTDRINVSSTGATFSVPLLGPAGTVSAVSHSFSADPNTGFNNPATDSIGVVSGGAETMRFSAAGRLLVGDTNQSFGSSCAVQVHNDGGTYQSTRYANSSGGDVFILGHTRSTTKGTVGTVLVNGDDVGTIRFQGDDGTDINTQAGRVRVRLDATPSTNRLTGRLDIALASGAADDNMTEVAAFTVASGCDVLSGDYLRSGTKVVGSRKTGWTAATGTATRTTFVTSTVTLPLLAERVKALIDDLISHGLIGT